MNILLIFFAIPVATIILAIVLQKILNCPLLVAATFFAIFLIVTFAVFDENFLVFAILYTLLAYITALIARFICCLIKNSNNPCINGKVLRSNCICTNSNNDDDDNNENENDSETDTNNCNNCDSDIDIGQGNQYSMRRNMMRR